ncbi:MAG: ABC transporter substrate-binding protein [Clostridiaceae bacterium]|jgi:branched-chain amino acid transport system substrate-binding protein|nr:ABC transporter substrate-binding protein [Clostridiaceae bacterium]
MKKVFMFLMVVVLLFSIAACGEKTSSGSKDKIRIALTAPLTGNQAKYGESFKNTVSLACKQWNDKGGVLGRELELVINDSAGDSAQAASVAQKVVSDSSIFAQVGDFSAPCSMAAQPIYDAAKMIQIAPTCSAVTFARGSKWSFQIVGNQVLQGRFMAQWMFDEGVRKVAMLYLNNDWGVSVKDYVGDIFKELGGEVVLQEPYSDGETDFSAALTKARDANPDALFIASYYNDGAAICIQRANLGWEIPVYNPGTVYSPEFLEIGGSAVEGVLTNVGFFPDDPGPAAATFVEEYKNLYKSDPDYYGACAYDAFNVLVEAIKRAGELDNEKVREEIAATDYEGVTGNITFDENGDALKTYIKIIVKDGKFTAYR